MMIQSCYNCTREGCAHITSHIELNGCTTFLGDAIKYKKYDGHTDWWKWAKEKEADFQRRMG